MAEGLRKVAQLAPLVREVLLGEEPDVVAQPYQLFEEALGIFTPAHQLINARQPERARQKRSLLALEAVRRFVGAIAKDEALGHEFPLYSCHRTGDSRIVR